MKVRRRKFSFNIFAMVVTFFVVSGMSGYVAQTLISKPSPIRDVGFCAELMVDVQALKQTFLNGLREHVRRELQAQRARPVRVQSLNGSVVAEFPARTSRDDALLMGRQLNFPLLANGEPGLTLNYNNRRLVITPTAMALSERLRPAMTGSIERLQSRYTSVDAERFEVKRLNPTRIRLRLSKEDGRQVFSKRMEPHPAEASIRYLRLIERTNTQGQRHERFRDRAQPGWFDPGSTYHLSRRAIVHERQLTSVDEIGSQPGARLLRLRLQSDAAHRVKSATEKHSDEKLSLSVHNRVVSTIRASDINAYGVIDFPVPDDPKQVKEIMKDIRSSFTQTALKVVKTGSCGYLG